MKQWGSSPQKNEGGGMSKEIGILVYKIHTQQQILKEQQEKMRELIEKELDLISDKIDRLPCEKNMKRIDVVEKRSAYNKWSVSLILAVFGFMASILGTIYVTSNF